MKKIVDLCTPITVRKAEVLGFPAIIIETKEGDSVAFGDIRDALLRLAGHFEGNGVGTPRVTPGKTRQKRVPKQRVKEAVTLKDWVLNYMAGITIPVSSRQVHEAALAAGRETTLGGIGFYMTTMKKNGFIVASEGIKKTYTPTPKLRKEGR